MPEPSLLDYLKAFLSFGRRALPAIPAAPKPGRKPADLPRTVAKPTRKARTPIMFPWRSLLALILFLGAQLFLAAPAASWLVGIVLMLAAGGLAGWAARYGGWRRPPSGTTKR